MNDAESGDSPSDDDDVSTAVILDYLPHGRTEDDRPQYQKEPLIYGLEEDEFGLCEVTITDDADFAIGDRVPLDESEAVVERIREIEFEDLPSGAQSELEYAVEDVVDTHEERFVDFYNDAQPITLRLHQLNLLPGIGKKLRNNILDEREGKPFEDFEDIESRVSGLHDPKQVLIDRILEEIREDDLKYRTFAQHEE